MPVVTGRRDAYGEGKRRAPVPESRPTLLGEAGERDSQRAGRARRPRSCRLVSLAAGKSTAGRRASRREGLDVGGGSGRSSRPSSPCWRRRQAQGWADNGAGFCPVCVSRSLPKIGPARDDRARRPYPPTSVASHSGDGRTRGRPDSKEALVEPRPAGGMLERGMVCSVFWIL